MAVTGLDLALADQPALLVVAGLTGMLGAASVDLGPFASVEQAVLAEAVPPSARNVAFGRYSLTAGLFNAAGGLAAALATGAGGGTAFFLLYAAIGVVTAALPLLMSRARRGAGPAGRVRKLPPAGRPRGAFRAGFAGRRLRRERGHRLLAARPFRRGRRRRWARCSGRSPSCRRSRMRCPAGWAIAFGLINTMVFTHLPSNILLLLVPFSPNFAWAVGLLLARFALSQMDVPARQAYVVSIVPAAERAGAVAMTGAVRGVAQSFGPVLAGLAIGAASFGLPFFAGGGLKIVYDLALFGGFRNRRAEHER